MYVRKQELKLTSDPQVREYPGFSRIVFCCIAKDASGEFDPTNQILCSHRFSASSGHAGFATLSKGNQVVVAGVFEIPSNEGGGEVAHRLCADSLVISPQQQLLPQPTEYAPEP